IVLGSLLAPSWAVSIMPILGRLLDCSQPDDPIGRHNRFVAGNGCLVPQQRTQCACNGFSAFGLSTSLVRGNLCPQLPAACTQSRTTKGFGGHTRFIGAEGP